MSSTNVQVKRETTELEKSENISDQPNVKKVTTLSSEDRLTLRARRFGGADKLQQRAQRFGTAKDGEVSKSDKPSDEVLKKRAERFGLAGSSGNKKGALSGGVECDAQTLKKRAERFGVISSSVKELDSQDKLAKRQKRFGTLSA